MYSGDQVLYGIKIKECDLFEFLNKKCDEDDNKYKYKDILNTKLESMNINTKLNIIFLHCCRYDKILYIGLLLGGNGDVAYRNNVSEYNTLEEYRRPYINTIDSMEKIMNENADKVKTVLDKLFPNNIIKIWSMANDCEYCT